MKSLNKRCFFSFVLAVLLALFPSSAETITFSADSMSGKTGKDADNTTLSGNAFVKTTSMEISADEIKLHGHNFRYITATGNVKGKNTQSALDFSSGSLEYDRETKIAVLKEKVSLSDSEKGVETSAEIIEYNQNLEIAIMQIGVKLTQKNNVCSSAYAIYRKKAQVLNMSGNARVVQDDDIFRAQEITLNLETQEITLDGKVKGNVSTSTPEGKEAQPENNEEKETQNTKDVINDFNSEESAKKEEAQNADEKSEEAASKKKKKKKK